MTFTASSHKNLFLSGKRSAEEMISAQFKRIEQHDPFIGAFLSTFPERALSQARALDQKRAQGKPLGSLAGIPIALKDNMHVRGEISSCASKFLANYKAPFDSTVARLIEEQDGIIIGKTNLDEFAMGSSTENSAFHTTKNPWNLECTPGGSSGGSAAAVSARLALLALGSDTGGSIRQPASFCGVVGFKPTYGRVSRYGLVAFGSSFDQIGPFAPSVEDAALIMETLATHCDKDSTSLPLKKEAFLSKLNRDSLKGKKIGVPRASISGLSAEIEQNFSDSLKLLEKLGAEIVTIDLSMLKYAIACYYILSTAEASTNLARFDGVRYGVRSSQATRLEEVYDLSREEGFGPEVKNRILLGTFVLSSGYKDAFYKKAQKVRTLFIEQFNRCFAQCDCIAMPTAPSTAFSLGAIHTPLEMYLQDIFTIPANLAGLPAINIPSGLSKEQKPFGLQLIAPVLHDAALLSYAYAFEQGLHLKQQIPSPFSEDLL